jgi:hypothetical protein
VGAYFHLEERSRSSNGYPKGDKYVGEYKDDKRNGQGTHTFANGNKYVGEFCYKKGITVLDFFGLTVNDKSLFTGDGIHVNELGVAAQAKLIAEVVK